MATELRLDIERLAQAYGLAELYAFGSRAQELAGRVRGELAPERADGGVVSDIDIGVRPSAGRRLDVHDLVRLAGELEEVCDAPRADVVLLPRANPFLALEIIRGELLYCADPDAQAEYELYVLRRAGDLAPFQRARHDLVLSRYDE